MPLAAAAAAAKSLQSCPTLCDPIDGSPPGSPIPGILQARTLEWVAISFCIVYIIFFFHPLVQCVVRKLSLYFVQYSYLSRKLTEKAMAPHSSTLAWKIPWTEEPGGLQSMGLLRVGHD